MHKVELIYHAGCPDVDAARAALLRAFAEVGMAPRWQEWQEDDPDAPAHVRGLGSPTLLVDGVDVAAAARPGDASCRLYTDPGGTLLPVPSVESIVAALRRSAPGGRI